MALIPQEGIVSFLFQKVLGCNYWENKLGLGRKGKKTCLPTGT